MDETLTQKVQQDFDRIARLETGQWNHNSHYHCFLLQQLPPHCERVLEIGCGTGEFSRLLAERADTVVAIDLSPTMIAVAQQQSGQYPNIDFQVADILKWQFPIEPFNAILLIATVHHLPIETLLPSLNAALKPGGKLVILDLVEREDILDMLMDAIAVPLNWLLNVFKNRRITRTPEAVAAWREHIRTDYYLTRSQAQQIYSKSLPGAKLRKHLFWRYSVVWEKPSA